MLMSKKIVVTGGAGFIGSVLLTHLNDLGEDRIVVVDDPVGKEKNLEGKRFLDLIPKEKVFSCLDGVEAIFHLGACSDTLEKNLSYLLENNYLFSINLAKKALEKGARFIYASSAATYGGGEMGFSDDILEDLRPTNMYALSKYLFDLWAERERVLDRMVGLKYFNVFGPNEYHKKHMASMVFKMMKRVEGGDAITLYKSNDRRFKDGEQKRDFIYVKDACHITALFLDELRDVNGIFNVGSGVATSWNSLAKALFKALSKDPHIKYVEMPKDLKAQYQNYTLADMSKLFSLSEYRCRDIYDAVCDYVKNYLVPGRYL